nr:MAG TPA: hypothetical protein [Caudoviricetes sp.]
MAKGNNFYKVTYSKILLGTFCNLLPRNLS